LKRRIGRNRSQGSIGKKWGFHQQKTLWGGGGRGHPKECRGGHVFHRTAAESWEWGDAVLTREEIPTRKNKRNQTERRPRPNNSKKKNGLKMVGPFGKNVRERKKALF